MTVGGRAVTEDALFLADTTGTLVIVFVYPPSESTFAGDTF